MAKKKVETLKKKRFVISKGLIGKGEIIEFVNTKGDTCVYDHDVVYTHFQEKFDTMPCFEKYGNYTNSKNLPKFVREFLG
tara:strand:+ start:70 stop:309 length:240 start_codon:yes stop_codon:yes gene_type:complete